MRDTHTFKKVLDRPGARWEIDIELTPDEYAAIGRVSAQWAFLDAHIIKFCSLVADRLGEPLSKDFTSDSFRKRKRAWAALVAYAFPEGSEERSSMEKIIRSAGDLQGERQTAIHSLFEWDKSDPSKLKGYSHKNPGGRARSHSVESLTKIGDKIAELNADFMMWPDDMPYMEVGFHSYRNTPGSGEG